MIVGIPKETKTREYRVALVPGGGQRPRPARREGA